MVNWSATHLQFDAFPIARIRYLFCELHIVSAFRCLFDCFQEFKSQMEFIARMLFCLECRKWWTILYYCLRVCMHSVYIVVVYFQSSIMLPIQGENVYSTKCFMNHISIHWQPIKNVSRMMFSRDGVIVICFNFSRISNIGKFIHFEKCV